MKSGYFEIGDAPRIDLSGGFEEYLVLLKKRKISFKNLMYNLKRLERDIGPIRFVSDCNNKEILRHNFCWKSQRYDLGYLGELASWISDIHEEIHNLKNTSFSGVLSALYAGDNLLAVHFGLRHQGILHYWFPAFNPKFSKYSPGLLLLYYLVSELKTLRCHILDFGPGEEQYKRHFSNSALSFMRVRVRTGLLSFAKIYPYKIRRKIRSINWLYQGLRPIVRVVKKITSSEKRSLICFNTGRMNGSKYKE